MLNSVPLHRRQFRSKRLLALLAILSAGFVSQTYGQIDGLLNFKNRVEGISVRQNALDDFELLAITRNFEYFLRNAALKVRFFLPSLSDTSTEVCVEAVELQDSHHYFMRSAKTYQWKQGDWNIFGIWPTSDVIDKLNLDAANIGVRAWYRTKNRQRVYVPVDVYQTNEQFLKRTYRFHFVTGQDLRSIDVSVTNAAGTAMKLPLPILKCAGEGCVFNFAGSTGRFDLDMSSLNEGEYHVKLVGHVPESSATTALNVTLYHHR